MLKDVLSISQALGGGVDGGGGGGCGGTGGAGSGGSGLGLPAVRLPAIDPPEHIEWHQFIRLPYRLPSCLGI